MHFIINMNGLGTYLDPGKQRDDCHASEVKVHSPILEKGHSLYTLVQAPKVNCRPPK
jgi:hypothetical protein